MADTAPRPAEPQLRREADGSVTEILDMILNRLPATSLCAGAKPTLDNEFVYYSSALRTLLPTFAGSPAARAVMRWVHKLYGPAFHCDMFKEKRNRYVLALVLTLLDDDEARGMFAKPPPAGALVEVGDWSPPDTPPPSWELDTSWQDAGEDGHGHVFNYRCSVHKNGVQCPPGTPDRHALADCEFRFLLHLAQPYAALLPSGDDKKLLAAWLQALCSVRRDACFHMKAVRNDYIKALLGYVSELRVAGPFVDYPSTTRLLPLYSAAKRAARGKPLTDPTSREAADFMRDQPAIETGAFCFVAVTGCCPERKAGARPPRRRPGEAEDQASQACRRLETHACVGGIASRHGLQVPPEPESRRERAPKGASSRISFTLPGQSC
ncbi:uncharacterized protein LOC134532265 [Bacillus rossius redtenbacheri]|uniref:uncharacterized protein LOC134532265 n=1 Tax=Bacillus rossius redtenbacheri TaxID=93214 RepID=UPI002FDE3E90